MKIMEDVARRLAEAVFEVEKKTGDPDLGAQVSKSLGDSSQTLQEAFLASIRFLRAEHRAMQIVTKAAQQVAAKDAAKKKPAAPSE